jgi:hypothetical protein
MPQGGEQSLHEFVSRIPLENVVAVSVGMKYCRYIRDTDSRHRDGILMLSLLGGGGGRFFTYMGCGFP